MEQIQLKAQIENVNGNPKVGYTLEAMKVAENCEELFKKENNTYYMRNDDKRSRLDK